MSESKSKYVSIAPQAVKVGDIVRVVVEGKVTLKASDNIEVGGQDLYLGEDEIVSVEEVIPLPVKFQPGDIVRQKYNGSVWQILNEGYVRLGRTGSGTAFEPVLDSNSAFTDEFYEKIEVGQ